MFAFIDEEALMLLGLLRTLRPSRCACPRIIRMPGALPAAREPGHLHGSAPVQWVRGEVGPSNPKEEITLTEYSFFFFIY